MNPHLAKLTAPQLQEVERFLLERREAHVEGLLSLSPKAQDTERAEALGYLKALSSVLEEVRWAIEEARNKQQQ
jgi:hypothetical protein